MVEPELPLKKKDQIALDAELTFKLHAEEQAELEKIQKERDAQEEANIAIIEKWNEVQAKMEPDMELAQRLQSKEQEQYTDEEKAKLFMELLEKKWKFFARKKEIEKRNRPPTKAQQRNLMSMKRVNTLVDMDTEIVEKRSRKTQAEATEGNEQVEDEKGDDQEEMEKHMEIVVEEEIAIDDIPLATKPPVIVEYKLIREGIMGHYQLIRADGSFKRYSSMIMMLQGIDREDLQTL
ncbi:hypothetical protein Tco_1482055 [Tanacetum coccineum]